MGYHGISSYSSAAHMPTKPLPASSRRRGRGQQPLQQEDRTAHDEWSTPAAVAMDSISPPVRSPSRSAPVWSAADADVGPGDAASRDRGSPSRVPASLPVHAWSTPAAAAGVDPSDVALIDLGSRSILAEDLERCFRLWTRLVILIAGRNLLDRLPENAPETILYLDLSFNR